MIFLIFINICSKSLRSIQKQFVLQQMFGWEETYQIQKTPTSVNVKVCALQCVGFSPVNSSFFLGCAAVGEVNMTEAHQNVFKPSKPLKIAEFRIKTCRGFFSFYQAVTLHMLFFLQNIFRSKTLRIMCEINPDLFLSVVCSGLDLPHLSVDFHL